MSKKPEKCCSACGQSIRNVPYALSGEGYCCESCFLASRTGNFDETSIRAIAAFVEALAAALDLREHETGLHSTRVACHTLELARRFEPLHPDILHQIYWGALLHDLGKIGVPDSILLKHGPLTESEWVEMRTHPEKGYAIVEKIPGMQGAAEIVLCHEERFDGSGYPQGLTGEAIPWGARLFAVVDTLDAMTSDRPYRKGLSFEAAKKELVKMSGRQFDPVAVELFLNSEPVMRDMVSLKCGTAHAADLFNQK